MNTRTKGTQLEKKVADELEADGCVVLRTRASRYGNQDFFGLWDIICFAPGGFLYFIQVSTTNRHSPTWRADALEFIKNLNAKGFIALGVEWVWKKNIKDWKKYPISSMKVGQ